MLGFGGAVHQENFRVSSASICGLFLAAAASVLLTYVAPHWFPVAIDFVYFWEAPRRSEPYLLGTYFVNPPPALIPLQLLKLVSLVPGYVCWTVLSLVLFFLAARRLVGDQIALLSLLSAPFIQGLILGQAAMMLSAAILFAFSAPAFWCGVMLGAVATTKPQLLLAAPAVFLLRRDWAAILGMIVGGSSSVLLSALIFGLRAWFAWKAAISGFYEAAIRFRITVITPAALGSQLGLSMTTGLLIGLAVAVVLIIRFAKRANGANLPALVIVSSLLTSPYALTHDLVSAMPAVTAFIVSAPASIELALALCLFSGLFLPVTFTAVCALGALTPRDFKRPFELQQYVDQS